MVVHGPIINGIITRGGWGTDTLPHPLHRPPYEYYIAMREKQSRVVFESNKHNQNILTTLRPEETKE